MCIQKTSYLELASQNFLIQSISANARLACTKLSLRALIKNCNSFYYNILRNLLDTSVIPIPAMGFSIKKFVKISATLTEAGEDSPTNVNLPADRTQSGEQSFFRSTNTCQIRLGFTIYAGMWA